MNHCRELFLFWQDGDRLDNGSKFLVTVDRDCRELFVVDYENCEVEQSVELEQRLPADVAEKLSPDARAWNRGLKTIRPLSDGGFVVCDIFGIYRLSNTFEISDYVSIPEFTDIHSALPDGDLLIVSNTGTDRILWVDWEGKIHRSLDLHRWFPATPWMEHDMTRVAEQFAGDYRLMPLDWARESCHLNWAEQTPLGTMASCFIQGEVLFFNDGKVSSRVAAASKLHAPRYLEQTQSILFSASEENRVVEVDMEGNELWSMDGFHFAKSASLLPNGNVIVGDTNNYRIAEVDREKNDIVWECDLPGTPYDVQLWNGRA